MGEGDEAVEGVFIAQSHVPHDRITGFAPSLVEIEKGSVLIEENGLEGHGRAFHPVLTDLYQRDGA